jgi:hypothetical protein
VSNAFVFWPQDVAELSHSHLLQLQQLPGPVVLWAGWECNDLSVAGSGQGLAGPRSGTFFSLHKVLLGLHDLLGARLGYVLENVAMDVPWQRHQVVRADDQRLRQLLGEPLVLDQLGATAAAAASVVCSCQAGGAAGAGYLGAWPFLQACGSQRPSAVLCLQCCGATQAGFAYSGGKGALTCLQGRGARHHLGLQAEGMD